MTPRHFLFIFLALIAPVKLTRAEDAPAAQEESKPAPAPQKKAAPKKAASTKKKTPAKKKDYDYERSKYKSREMSEGTVRSYRFNEKGEPITAEAKKKASADKKRSSSSEDASLKSEACGDGDACGEKKTEADAL